MTGLTRIEAVFVPAVAVPDPVAGVATGESSTLAVFVPAEAEPEPATDEVTELSRMTHVDVPAVCGAAPVAGCSRTRTRCPAGPDAISDHLRRRWTHMRNPGGGFCAPLVVPVIPV